MGIRPKTRVIHPVFSFDVESTSGTFVTCKPVVAFKWMQSDDRTGISADDNRGHDRKNSRIHR